MNIINFSNYNFKKLQKLQLDNAVTNTEGILYVIPEKEKWNKEEKILKIFYNNIGEQFGNKLLTLNSLIDNASIINIDEIVMPEKLASVGDQIVGFTMPYIPSVNLQTLLNSYNISNEVKIDYLKQIGIILDKMKKVRENTKVKDFFVNDLHEGNFIFDFNTNKIHLVDIDSCRINNNKPFAAKYLSRTSSIANMPNKYICNEFTDNSGYIVPDENTDLYCYTVIVLNYLFKDKITKLNIEEFYTYINYLRRVGLPYKLLDKISKIYQYQDNENIYEYLDFITPSVLEKSSEKVFMSKLAKC